MLSPAKVIATGAIIAVAGTAALIAQPAAEPGDAPGAALDTEFMMPAPSVSGDFRIWFTEPEPAEETEPEPAEEIEGFGTIKREEFDFSLAGSDPRLIVAGALVGSTWESPTTGDAEPESELGAGVYTLSNDDGAWFGTGTDFGDMTIISLVGTDGYAGLNAAVVLDYETFEFEGAIYPEFMLGETADTASTD